MPKTIYFWLANLVFTLHFLLGLFYVLGWQFVDWKYVYLTLMSGWIGSWILLGYCPLSKCEFTLRNKYDATIDPNTEIIQHYIYKFSGKKVPSHIIFMTGLLVYVVLIALSLTR